MKDNTSNQAYLKLHTGILLASVTGIFGRWMSLTEIPLVWYRMMIASAVLAGVLFAGKQLRRIPVNHLVKIGGCGMILATHWIFFYGSIKASNVSIGVVCLALEGLFTAILEPLINRHRPSMRELLLSLLTLAGILLIFGLDARYRYGILLGTVAALMYSIFSIFSKRIQHNTGHKSSTMLLYELLCGGLILTLLMPAYSMLHPTAQMLPKGNDWWMLPIFASLFTITPFLLQLQALRHISAFTVNLSYNLQPIYSIVLANIAFNEASELNIFFWSGLFLVLLSVLLQTHSALEESGHSILHSRYMHRLAELSIRHRISLNRFRR